MSPGSKNQPCSDFSITVDSEDPGDLHDLTTDSILVAFTPEHPSGPIAALREGVCALFADLEESSLHSPTPRHWLLALRAEINKEPVPRNRILRIESFEELFHQSSQEQRDFVNGARQISTCLSITVAAVVSNSDALARSAELLASTCNEVEPVKSETPKEVSNVESVLFLPEKTPKRTRLPLRNSKVRSKGRAWDVGALKEFIPTAESLSRMIAAVLFISTALSAGIAIAKWERRPTETVPIPALAEAPIIQLNPRQIYSEAEDLCLGSDRDLDRGIELLNLAADKGDPDAIELLGTFYSKGHGVEMDRNRAKDLFELADEEGSRSALGNLGVMALQEGNHPKALSLFREGAARNDPEAMFYLAECLERGLGTREDPAKAEEWFLAAATRDHPEALAWCFASIPDYDPDGAFASTSDGELD